MEMIQWSVNANLNSIILTISDETILSVYAFLNAIKKDINSIVPIVQHPHPVENDENNLIVVYIYYII